jgi:hypothetical protein
VNAERPRLFFARPEDLHHHRAHLEALGELQVEIGIAFEQHDRPRRLHRPRDHTLRRCERNRAAVGGIALAAGRGDGVDDLRVLRLLVDRMEQPSAVGAELLARDRHDPPQHFAQLQRAGEGLENRREKAVALFGAVARALRRAGREVARHQTANGVVGAPAGKLGGKLEHARHRLLALRRVAHPLPCGVPADGDQAESLAPEELHRFLFRAGDHRRASQRPRDFGRSARRVLRRHDEDLIGHGRPSAC